MKAKTNDSELYNGEAIDSSLLILFGGAFKSFYKKEYIFKEGDHPHFYHQVVEGKIKTVTDNNDGKEFIQGFFSAGQSFGEPSIFSNEVYSSSAIAVQPGIVIRLSVGAFMQMLKENFEVHIKLTRLLCQRLTSNSTNLNEMSCHSSEHRILSLLDTIKSEKNKLPGYKVIRLKIDYTRQQIAEMTGLRVETVIRVLRNLFDKNILTIEKGKVFY
ncbi:MAG: Crp/Fnr family transcriptional regulator [Chitinophagaceae bacterium]|nr:Crp/Fnr family transcriptional regulator [Chitinophagaceae bacterium]